MRRTVRAGMLTPSENVSVAKRSFTRPVVNSLSTISLSIGSMPAWWYSTPRAARFPDLAGVVGVLHLVPCGQLIEEPEHPAALLRREQVSPGVSSGQPLAVHPAEAEVDRGHQLALLEVVEQVVRGCPDQVLHLTPRLAPRSPATAPVAKVALEPSLLLEVPPNLVEGPGAPAGDPHLVGEGDRSALLHDDLDVRTPHLADPRGEVVHVRHRGGQGHDADVIRRVDDGLFPHGAAFAVVQVVDLVEDHEVADCPGQPVGILEDRVPEDLRRHDQQRRSGWIVTSPVMIPTCSSP